MSDVILRGLFGQDECNARGKSYRVNAWGCVRVPEEDVAPLILTGGFHRAVENDPTAPNSSLEDVPGCMSMRLALPDMRSHAGPCWELVRAGSISNSAANFALARGRCSCGACPSHAKSSALSSAVE